MSEAVSATSAPLVDETIIISEVIDEDGGGVASFISLS